MRIDLSAAALFPLGLALLVPSAEAAGTCTPGWIPTFPGQPDGWVEALAVFDAGSGPRLYAGGVFTSIGGTAYSRIAAWDGTAWSALGTGMSNAISDLAVYDDGGGKDLYAIGDFTVAGGVVAGHIARWNGTTWSSIGDLQGVFGTYNALAVFDDGSGEALYAGGSFTTAGGVAANRVARWNGSTWSPLGSGMPSGLVFALEVFDDGGGPALYAGGSFTAAGGAPANRVARWDGTSWSPLGSGMPSGAVFALTVFDDGAGPDLYAGGSFTMAGGLTANRIARWDGTSWSALGVGLNGACLALQVHDDGTGAGDNLYAGGDFTTANGGPASNIARWNGSLWYALGSGAVNDVFVLAEYDDGAGTALYAGGDFASIPDSGDAYLGRWGGCTGGGSAVFCAGDGSCPCGNAGAAGSGCDNAQATGGVALSLVAQTTAPNGATLQGSGFSTMGAPTAIVIRSNALDPSSPVVFGDGLRCVNTSGLVRLAATVASGGVSQHAFAHTAMAGSGSFYYQIWYRNTPSAYCTPAAFNLSSGLQITWP